MVTAISPALNSGCGYAQLAACSGAMAAGAAGAVGGGGEDSLCFLGGWGVHGGRRGGDRRVAEVLLLIAGGLELHARQQRVVGAHAPGGAVLDHQAGVAVE